MSKDLIQARLVYDGADDVYVPEAMGAPRSDQMQGTLLERLVELSGRCCYDSLGRGRNSVDYHAHLLESRHLSVHQHAVMTVRLSTFAGKLNAYVFALANRPGVWFARDGALGLRITFNACAVIEWDAWTQDTEDRDAHDMGVLLRSYAHKRMPQVVPPPVPRFPGDVFSASDGRGGMIWSYVYANIQAVEPESPDEKWVSLFLSASRGVSHEQVRHHYQTAVSQRSTRFCDESETPYVEHPLVDAYMDDKSSHTSVASLAVLAKHRDREAYAARVSMLEAWLKEQGVGEFSARKQARGAARGCLGNALQTEMIFSATVRQWRRQLLARASSGADAEIRQLYAGTSREDYPCVLAALRRTRYRDDFADLKRETSPDGIGFVLRT